MTEYLWMAGKAFLISLVLTPVFRDLFRSYNVVDRPGTRKVHQHPIPRIGGIPIAIAYTISLLSITSLSSSIPGHDSIAWKLLPGLILIFATGLIDDFFNLPPRFKLMGQIVAASAVFWSGLRIEEIAGASLPLWVSFPATILWLLLSTNALNLIDGLDGLCAGMGLLATLTLFGGGLIQGNLGLAHATFPLAGALLGFLCFNFNPATVFLGDSGALLIGFLLGCYGMIWTQKTTTLLSVSVPLLALAIPLMDVSLSVVRRYLNNRPIFSADRGHIHHRLLDRGMSVRHAVLVLYLVAAGVSSVALLLSSARLSRYHGVVMLVFGAAVFMGVRQLRYLEFSLFGKVLFSGEFKRSVAWQAVLERLTQSLLSAKTEDEWWERFVIAAKDAGWSGVRWDSSMEERFQVLSRVNGPHWSFHIPVEDDRITIDGPIHGDSNSKRSNNPAAKIDLLKVAEVVALSLAAKRVEWKQLAEIQ